jgi:hypothetical protein
MTPFAIVLGGAGRGVKEKDGGGKPNQYSM